MLIREVLRFNCIGTLRTTRVTSPITYFLNLVVALNILNLYLLKVLFTKWGVKLVKSSASFIYDHFRTTRFESLIR